MMEIEISEHFMSYLLHCCVSAAAHLFMNLFEQRTGQNLSDIYA